ncbi:MAG: hypothetical protein ABI877_10810 [Gemmatimonadaceae bacterium]
MLLLAAFKSRRRDKAMSEEKSGYKHDASDKKLDKAAEAEIEAEQATDKAHTSGPGHDAEKIRRHDDAGKDRLFEAREQHDDAEKSSEKNRLARDVARHDHPVDNDAGSGSGEEAERKS